MIFDFQNVIEFSRSFQNTKVKHSVHIAFLLQSDTYPTTVSNLSIFEHFCHPIFAHNSIKKAAEAAFLIPDFQIVSEFSGGLADRLVLAAGLLIVRRWYIRFINMDDGSIALIKEASQSIGFLFVLIHIFDPIDRLK